MNQNVKPRIRSGICLTLKTEGLRRSLLKQVELARDLPPLPVSPR